MVQAFCRDCLRSSGICQTVSRQKSGTTSMTLFVHALQLALPKTMTPYPCIFETCKMCMTPYPWFHIILPLFAQALPFWALSCPLSQNLLNPSQIYRQIEKESAVFLWAQRSILTWDLRLKGFGLKLTGLSGL